MKKYIVFLTVIVLFIGSFIVYNMRDLNIEKLSYNTIQDAKDNKLVEEFLGFEPIYEEQQDPNNLIVIYYNDSKDLFCAAVIESKNKTFIWRKITASFSFGDIAALNNKGAYVIYPVVINNTKLNICIGLVNSETKVDSNFEPHIINDKFLVIINKDKINISLL